MAGHAYGKRDIAFIGEPLTNKGVWNLRECYIGTSSVIMKFCIENIALHLRLANYACITGQWPKVTANWVQHVQTRPNETCFMHNFHAILNDCKVMYLKYINSFCAQSFGFCFNLNILVKKLGSVFLSRAVWKTVDQFLFALARLPIFSRGSQQFPVQLNFSQPSHLINIRQRITYKRYYTDATFLTHFWGCGYLPSIKLRS